MLAASVIAYQAAEKLPDLLASLKDEVDLVVVGVDPKTTDATDAVARSFGATTFRGIDPMAFPEELDLSGLSDSERDAVATRSTGWGFAAARALTFHKAKELGATWAIWIDTDDVLEHDPGVSLRQLVEEHKDASLVWLDYAYARDAYQNVTTLFQRERLINLSYDPRWVGALHETCTVDGRGRMARDRRAWVLHKNRTEAGKGERNFRLLEKMVALDQNDHRAVLYLGHQHFAAGNWEDAAAWYRKFVDLRSPGTPEEERWQANIYRAKALRSAGRVKDSIPVANAAMLMRPQYADSYFELAHAYALLDEHAKAVHWHEEGLRREKPDTILIQNPLDYEYNPFVTAHRSYAEMGNLEKAIECCNRALDWRPKEESLLSSRDFYVWARDRDESIAGGLKLAEHLLDAGEVEKAERILGALPAGAQGEGVEKARRETGARLAHLRDEAEYDLFYIDRESSGTSPDDWALSRLRKHRKVLVVGFGDGSLALDLAKTGTQVVGIEVDPKRVQPANRAAVEAGLLEEAPAPDYSEDPANPINLPIITPESFVQFRFGDGLNIPKPVKDLGPFDAAYIGGLLSRVPDPEKLLAEVGSVAKHVLGTTSDAAHPAEWLARKVKPEFDGVVRRWTQPELEGILLKRGRLVESRRVGENEGTLVFEYAVGEPITGRPPVAIFCGRGWEPWTPDQIDGKGLGGSETAVVHLAKALVDCGMRVMVYAEADGVWDGVYYRHWTNFTGQRPVFAFVAWRNPLIFDAPVQAEQRILWLHDVDAGPRLTEERAAKIDAVWCLSEWHRNHLAQFYPFIADKLVVIGNGIDPSRFNELPPLETAGERYVAPPGLTLRDYVERSRFRDWVAYASSPDRGLEQVLTYWPKVREKRPNAQLHIFYGWDNYELMGGDRAFKERILKFADQPGVVWRGRLGQRQLALEFFTCSALFYPGPHPFCETYCITVVEAQAAGCVPVTRDNGALPETNRYGVKLANLSPDEKWVEALVRAMGKGESYRQKMKDWARKQTWAAVADRVIRHFSLVNKNKALAA